MTLGNIFAGFAILISILSIFLQRRDVRIQKDLNRTQKDLNEILLHEKKEEIKVSSNAQIDLYAEKGPSGSSNVIISISCIGKIPVTNLNISISKDSNWLKKPNTFPIDSIQPGQVIRTEFILYASSIHKATANLSWDDINGHHEEPRSLVI